MTTNQYLSLIARYRKLLKKLDAETAETDYDTRLPGRKTALNHLLSMLPKMEGFIGEGRKEKSLRWLGFMQGVLWMLGEFSLNDLRAHNRPPTE